MTPIFVTDANVQSPGQQVHLDIQHASPPTQAYMNKDDQLYIMTSSAFTNVTVFVSMRLLMPDGRVVPSQLAIPAPATRSASYTFIPMPECFILSIAIQANVTGRIGGVFVQAIISRGTAYQGPIGVVLCSGYPTSNMGISWPSGQSTNNRDTAGYIRSITGTLPAAGANISETVPNNAKWDPISFMFTLTTSATVAARDVVITLDDGTNVFCTAIQVGTQAANTTVTYTALSNATNGTIANGVATLELFTGVLLLPGYRINTAVQNLQAGDQLSAPQYLVEEWLLP